VHELPSSHGVPFVLIGFEQAPPEHVPALWHWSRAVQVVPVPPVHAPLWQVSPDVQAFPSLHGVPFGLLGFAGHEPPEQLAWL
jgi:hypothetical protein